MIKGDDSFFPTNDAPHGVQLRTWMATQFMAADLGDPRLSASPETRATWAVEYTDALIAVLNKPVETK